MAFLIQAQIGTAAREQLRVVHARRKRLLKNGERVFVRRPDEPPFGCIVDDVKVLLRKGHPPEPYYFLTRW